MESASERPRNEAVTICRELVGPPWEAITRCGRAIEYHDPCNRLPSLLQTVLKPPLAHHVCYLLWGGYMRRAALPFLALAVEEVVPLNASRKLPTKAGSVTGPATIT
jgi:hypothetical protein